MKASREKFGAMPPKRPGPGGAGMQGGAGLHLHQRFLPSDSAFTSDNESEFESSRDFETSRESFSSSFMGSYFSSLRSPREVPGEPGTAESLPERDNVHNQSYTSGVTGKKGGLLAGFQVRQPFSALSPSVPLVLIFAERLYKSREGSKEPTK